MEIKELIEKAIAGELPAGRYSESRGEADRRLGRPHWVRSGLCLEVGQVKRFRSEESRMVTTKIGTWMLESGRRVRVTLVIPFEHDPFDGIEREGVGCIHGPISCEGRQKLSCTGSESEIDAFMTWAPKHGIVDLFRVRPRYARGFIDGMRGCNDPHP